MLQASSAGDEETAQNTWRDGKQITCHLPICIFKLQYVASRAQLARRLGT